MKKTSKRLSEALDRLADLYPGDGHLMAATDPAGFIDMVADELIKRRGGSTVALVVSTKGRGHE